jgi:hypothetical protein
LLLHNGLLYTTPLLYARHLSQPELNKRIRDIVLNLLILTPEAKVGLLPVSDDAALWMEKWTHVLEEMQLRYGPYPAGFTRDVLHSEPFPDFVSELAGRAAEKLSSLGLRPNEVLTKFGRQAHMQSLFEHGALRIQPASFFSQPIHAGAVRDDELTLPLSFVLSRDDVVKLVLNPQDVPSYASDQRVDVRLEYPTDYWLYCVTLSVEPRLFVDFDSDTCVIIKNRQAFSERLRAASANELASIPMREGPAIYIDPLLPKSINVVVPFCKHFGYSYQQEYRFCWLPIQTAKHLPYVDMRMGSLRDIADFVAL